MSKPTARSAGPGAKTNSGMASVEQVFHRLLGLSSSWRVYHIELEPAPKTLVIGIVETPELWEEESRRAGHRIVCHDHQEPRQWRHLNALGKPCVIVCALPRGRRLFSGEVYPIAPPWEGRSQSFTKGFETLALALIKEMPVSKAGELLGDVQPQVLWQMSSAQNWVS